MADMTRTIQLYAYFKIATGGDFANAPKPGMFDLKVRPDPEAPPSGSLSFSTCEPGTRSKYPPSS